MKSNLVIRKVKFVACFIGVIFFFCSFIVPSPVKFSAMLMKKADVATLMANSSFSYMILVNTNIGADDNLRLTYQTACYAFNSSNQLISGFNPLRLTKSIPDSSYTKDISLSSYKITKATLSTVIPTTVTYSFLRFAPYADVVDAQLANFISYSIFPVGADGVTGVLVGKAVPTTKLNPSPPR